MTYSLQDKPALRWPLEVQQIEEQGEHYLVLIDPEQLSSGPVLIPGVFYPILSQLDGEHELSAILLDGSPFGLTREILLQFVEGLAKQHLIDNSLTRSKIADSRKAFIDAPLRKAFHAGSVYPEDREELAAAIEDYIVQTAGGVPVPQEHNQFAAMICPHIDYRRGWKTYGAAYHALKAAQTPDVVFLIGTSHQAGRSLFQLTKKDFETPLGLVRTEQAFVDALSRDYGIERSFRDEFLHMREHSLELQLPFLIHRYGPDRSPAIVPILVGSFQHLFDRPGQPLEDQEVADFVGSLAQILADLRAQGRSAMFFAGVDLAHIGQYFGDAARTSDADLEKIAARDKELLSAVYSGSAEDLFAHMAEDRDQRRICGYPSMYTMLAALRAAGISVRGKELEYRQAVDKTSDCIVTFASAYWTAV